MKMATATAANDSSLLQRASFSLARSISNMSATSSTSATSNVSQPTTGSGSSSSSYNLFRSLSSGLSSTLATATPAVTANTSTTPANNNAGNGFLRKSINGMSRLSVHARPSNIPKNTMPHYNLNELNAKLNEEVIKIQKPTVEAGKKTPPDEILHYFYGPSMTPLGRSNEVKVLHGLRKILIQNTNVWLSSDPLQSSGPKDLQRSISNQFNETKEIQKKAMRNQAQDPNETVVNKENEKTTRSSFGMLPGKIFAAGKYFGQKVAYYTYGDGTSTYINENSFCDGCGMDPIIGVMWSCSVCSNYHLCDGCYRMGRHGYEKVEFYTHLREEFLLHSLLEKSKYRIPEEVFTLLFYKVCKRNMDKFKFLAHWIIDVIMGVKLSQLNVHGIAIPHLDAETRPLLVELLTPVLATRTNIEVRMEWFLSTPESPDTSKSPQSNGSSPTSESDKDSEVVIKEETLRIWICNTENEENKMSVTDSDGSSKRKSSAADYIRKSLAGTDMDKQMLADVLNNTESIQSPTTSINSPRTDISSPVSDLEEIVRTPRTINTPCEDVFDEKDEINNPNEDKEDVGHSELAPNTRQETPETN